MEHKNLSFGARLGFALRGLLHGLKAERSLRVHVVCVGLVLLLLVLVRPAPIWWGLVALASAGVVGAELFNTAIEHLADHLHPQVHPGIQVVKDCAAAAVLVSALGALGVA